MRDELRAFALQPPSTRSCATCSASRDRAQEGLASSALSFLLLDLASPGRVVTDEALEQHWECVARHMGAPPEDLRRCAADFVSLVRTPRSRMMLANVSCPPSASQQSRALALQGMPLPRHAHCFCSHRRDLELAAAGGGPVSRPTTALLQLAATLLACRCARHHASPAASAPPQRADSRDGSAGGAAAAADKGGRKRGAAAADGSDSEAGGGGGRAAGKRRRQGCPLDDALDRLREAPERWAPVLCMLCCQHPHLQGPLVRDLPALPLASLGDAEVTCPDKVDAGLAQQLQGEGAAAVAAAATARAAGRVIDAFGLQGRPGQLLVIFQVGGGGAVSLVEGACALVGRLALIAAPRLRAHAFAGWRLHRPPLLLGSASAFRTLRLVAGTRRRAPGWCKRRWGLPAPASAPLPATARSAWAPAARPAAAAPAPAPAASPWWGRGGRRPGAPTRDWKRRRWVVAAVAAAAAAARRCSCRCRGCCGCWRRWRGRGGRRCGTRP